MLSNQNISARTYEVLHAAYDEINATLLEGKLPQTIGGGIGHGAGAHQAEVAARVGFGQAHGGQPFAAGHFGQVDGFQRG